MANLDIKECLDLKNYETNGGLLYDLIRRNMFHVAEKIFFHLDYDSYTNCLDVCKEWRSFLSSKSTFARAKREFGGKMWVSALKAKKLPRIKIAPRINIICWTTNGREVAYIEDEAVAGVTVLHFIGRADRKSQVRQFLGFCSADSEANDQLY